MSIARKLARKTPEKKHLSKEALKIRKMTKQADLLTNAGISKTQKDSKLITDAIGGMSYIFLANILYGQEKESKNKVIQMIKGVQRKMECICENRTTWEDIEEYEVKHTDKEYYPIKWTDYAKREHDYKVIFNGIDPKGDNEIINAIAKIEAIRIADSITHHMELAIMSGLHDYFGYGLKRLKRIITMYRKMFYLPSDEIREIIAQTKAMKIFFCDEMDDSLIEKFYKFFERCLVDKEWQIAA